MKRAMVAAVAILLFGAGRFTAPSHTSLVQIRDVHLEGSLLCWNEPNTTHHGDWDKYCSER